MKTYFNYEGQILSKDLAEAIAFPNGMGPMFGFAAMRYASQEDTYKLTTSNESDVYKKAVADRAFNRKLALKDDGTPIHGLINKTGHLWVSTQEEISISIKNSKSNYDELMVFAVFQEIQSPVENTPSIVGFWNQGTTSFYSLWKRSIDPAYNTELTSVDDALNTDPWAESGLSRVDLDDAIIAGLGSYADWYRDTGTVVLIGVYGSGSYNDDGLTVTENFALVPYFGEFPQVLPFNPVYYNKLKKALKYINTFVTSGLVGLGTQNYASLKDYIDEVLGNVQIPEVDAGGIIPIGGIILWSGTSIPDGWHICDGTNGTPNLSGKFVKAYGDGEAVGTAGGEKEITISDKNLPNHNHRVYYKKSNKSIDTASQTTIPVPSNSDCDSNSSLKPIDSGGNGWEYDATGISTGEGGGTDSPESLSIIPPYYVLYYIQRIS